jgi:CubicO group peptidase (beta-lactamase class C family)
MPPRRSAAIEKASMFKPVAKVFLLTTLVLVLLASIILVVKAAPLITMASGYMAKSMCSEHFVAGRQDLEGIRSDILDIDPMFRWISYDVNPQHGYASGFVGPGIGRVTAVYREGLGCTLAVGTSPEDLLPIRAEDAVSVAYDAIRPLPVAAGSNAKLQRVFDEAFAEPAVDSHRQTRAVVVLHHGAIVGERYAEPFGPETPLIGWSMTKSITNNLVGILVADGVLALDDPAPVPDWRRAGDVRGGITLRHLLQMSSGLDFSEVYEPGSDATNMLFASHSAGGFAAAAGLAYPPGSHWSYSSGTTNILARIVFEQVGGSTEALYRFMQTRLFMPLGLKSMVVETDASGAMVGSSFSYATARDWARLGQFWLQDGVWEGRRILPEGWMSWSTRPAPAAPHGEYGAQFWLNAGRDGQHKSFPDLPSNLFFANGFNDQTVAVFPDEEIVAVRLGFTTDGSWQLGEFLGGVYAALAEE